MQRYIYNVFSLSSNSFEHKNTFKSFLNTHLGQLKTSIASSYYRWRIVKYLRPNKKPQCHIEFIVKVLLIYERIFWLWSIVIFSKYYGFCVSRIISNFISLFINIINRLDFLFFIIIKQWNSSYSLMKWDTLLLTLSN